LNYLFKPPERKLEMTNNSLSRLVEMARAIRLDDTQKDEQRRSFVYGNTAIENDRITRTMVDDAAKVVKAS
jgi:hypothetical protein